MNTYEAKNLLLQSLRCLAMSMEQIRLREIEKVAGYDEPMQDHLAQCTCGVSTPYEGSSVENCCEYLQKLYKGFEEASNHEILLESKFEMASFDVAHICDMIMGFIGHEFPENLIRCAREIDELAYKTLPAKDLYVKSDTMCKNVVACFLKRADKVIEKHGYKNWKTGEYSLSLGYLGEWMKRKYWAQ